MEVKISVIIPTYQRPELLKRCIGALLKQSFSQDEYEIIVISDGPDNSAEKVAKSLAKNAKTQIKYLSTEIKKGPAAARNLGWMSAKGNLIAFTDDDCIPSYTWLSDIWKAYNEEEEIAFTGKVTVPIPAEPTDYELNLFHLETAEFVTANCACTKMALLKTGGFDERFQIAWREDSDLHFKLIEHHIPIKPIRAVVEHPVRKAPWGISIKEQKKGIFNALLYKKHPILYRERIKPAPSWNYYFMVLFVIVAIIGLISNLHLLFVGAALLWLILLTEFIRKRLSFTSQSAPHVIEIIITSIFIPFLSIYWQIYGAVKYKVLFF